MTVNLTPEDFWRIGSGVESFLAGQEKVPDALPAAEPIISWNNGKGSLTVRYRLAPASAVKGALRHRVAYHYNRLNCNFAERSTKLDPKTENESLENSAAKSLFGFARDQDDAGPTGAPGRIEIDDIYLDPTAGASAHALMHNSIDSFSGGVRDGLLFTEELTAGGDIPLNLTIRPGPTNEDPSIRKALDLALLDLTTGRLSLGAGGGEGHGRMILKPAAVGAKR